MSSGLSEPDLSMYNHYSQLQKQLLTPGLSTTPRHQSLLDPFLKQSRPALSTTEERRTGRPGGEKTVSNPNNPNNPTAGQNERWADRSEFLHALAHSHPPHHTTHRKSLSELGSATEGNNPTNPNSSEDKDREIPDVARLYLLQNTPLVGLPHSVVAGQALTGPALQRETHVRSSQGKRKTPSRPREPAERDHTPPPSARHVPVDEKLMRMRPKTHISTRGGGSRTHARAHKRSGSGRNKHKPVKNLVLAVDVLGLERGEALNGGLNSVNYMTERAEAAGDGIDDRLDVGPENEPRTTNTPEKTQP